ncbi:MULTISPECIES: metallophosphoesterase family protein [Actinomycetes]|uniref:Calcineurin-like phosphoesterase domain-containing protein n=2 Tax=Actinomycetes TaxID=1760 RepID=A0ABP6LS47_9MICC
MVHLSDLQLGAPGTDGLGSLDLLVEDLSREDGPGRRADAVIITGDLVHQGTAESYPMLAAALRCVETRLAAPVLCALGDHDDAIAAKAIPSLRAGSWTVHRLGPLRLVLLDSSSGRLGEAQLRWMRRRLATDAPWGSVVCLHHPPVATSLASPPPYPFPRDGAADALRAVAADASAFTEALEGTDTRVVLAGHGRHALMGEVAGAGLLAAPSWARQRQYVVVSMSSGCWSATVRTVGADRTVEPQV